MRCVRRLARRATQCEPLEMGIASVGLSLSGAESHLLTVGSVRKVGCFVFSVFSLSLFSLFSLLSLSHQRSRKKEREKEKKCLT